MFQQQNAQQAVNVLLILILLVQTCILVSSRIESVNANLRSLSIRINDEPKNDYKNNKVISFHTGYKPSSIISISTPPQDQTNIEQNNKKNTTTDLLSSNETINAHSSTNTTKENDKAHTVQPTWLMDSTVPTPSPIMISTNTGTVPHNITKENTTENTTVSSNIKDKEQTEVAITVSNATTVTVIDTLIDVDTLLDDISDIPSIQPSSNSQRISTSIVPTISPTEEGKIFVIPKKTGVDSHYTKFVFQCDNDEYYFCGQIAGFDGHNLCNSDIGSMEKSLQSPIMHGGDNKVCYDLLTREELAPRKLFNLPLCPNNNNGTSTSTAIKSYTRYSTDGTRSQLCTIDGCSHCSTGGSSSTGTTNDKKQQYDAIHFTTLDKTIFFEYTGQCDLLLLSRNATKYTGLDIQIRTRIVPTTTKTIAQSSSSASSSSPGGVTLVNRIGIKIGKDVLEAAHNGEIYFNYDLIYKNIRTTPPSDGILEGIQINSKYTIMKSTTITGSKQFSSNVVRLSLRLDDDEEIVIVFHSRKMDLQLHNITLVDSVVGILGTSTSTTTTHTLIGRDGITNITNVNDYVSEWQVQPDIDMVLFKTIQIPMYPRTCQLPYAPI